MTQTSKTIVFFGSGPVAAESLRLLAKNFAIEAVVTKPKPAHHRGEFPVLATAEHLNIPTFTVTNRADLSQLIATKPFKSRVGVLIDFGIIVGQDTIDYFPLGIVNSHFSVLPDLRGADPITFAILSGQTVTGVSLMLLVKAMDEGPLLGYGEQPLTGTETTPTLTAQLINLSDALLTHELPRYMASPTKGTPQTITGRAASYSRKLTKQDGILDWTKPALALEREVRAFIDWPKSHTQLAGKDVDITAAHVDKNNTHQESASGKVLVTDEKQLAVTTSDGLFIIDTLKPAGKNQMTSQAFLAGHRSQLL